MRADSGRLTGAKRMDLPWATISRTPRWAASARSLAKEAKRRVGSGTGPYRSASSSSTSATSDSLRAAANLV